jgi:hypothetical protein
MEEKKLFGKVCPTCGELYAECQYAVVALGVGVQINMMCEQQHKWSEFYHLTYAGYWCEGKKYDTYGEELKADEL